LQQVDGELVKLERKAVQQKLRLQVGKARSLEQLQAIGRERGYSPGWAFRLYKARGGR
jgi:hypothetical protein